MSLIMFDSIDVAAIPASGMSAVAGYVGGKWPTFNALRARFPHVPALSIAVNATQDAQCLDVEAGDATPAQVPGWLDRMAKAHPGRTNIIYCPASSIAGVRKAAGSRHYLLWSAHYTYTAHICGSCGYPGADATQFADKGPHGENVDQTVMSPAFLAAFAPPAPKPAAPVVNHNTGIGSEKPWGAFPLRSGYYGIGGHDGSLASDQRAVRQIQREVGAIADGKFGAQTKAAVGRWQTNHHLSPDGEVGPLTWAAMTKSN